ncbi:MAG: TonB-dependent receptor [Bacteroidetes bacterium]|nr:TonB-dependent receptor [Bacteroidota bacterium]
MKLSLFRMLLLLCSWFLCTHIAMAQCSVHGMLHDTLGHPIPFNAVALIQNHDSSIVKGVMTQEDGSFCFESISKGIYRIKVSAIGYETFFSESLDYDSTHAMQVPDIRLRSGQINLNEVSVSAQKKTIEFKNGNVIVNVEGTALAMGNTVYDLLARLPGVTVSDGNISIQGKSGVKIMIDGKIQQLAGPQLMNILKSMNASQVEKIEVLRKPPVRYDAAGTGGMINIKTKKIKMTGFSGNVFTSYSQGFYGNPSGGFTLNYKGRKVNFFTGFTAEREWFHNTERMTNAFNYNATETTLDSKSIIKVHNHYETYNLGADWFINKSNSIGIKMNGAFGMGGEDIYTNTNYSDNNTGYRNLGFHSSKPNPWIYPEFNLNAEHNFDTSGTVLRFSANYNPYWDIYDADFYNSYQDAGYYDVKSPALFKTRNTLTFTNSSALLDFEKELKHKLKLETGIKHSYQIMHSDYYLKNLDYTSGDFVTDSMYSNIFNYTQNISAGYINLTRDFEKVTIQAGLRGENTMFQTSSRGNSLNFHRQYFNLFPVLTFDYKPSDKHTFSLSYNKRVNRPDYNMFNPFTVFLSTQVSFKGNPYLKPEYSHDIGFTHSYNSWLNNSVNFTRINNTFMGYNTQNDSSKTYIHTSTNLNWADIYAYSLFIQKDLYKWWSVNLNATVFHINAKGNINNQPYRIQTTAFQPSLYSRLTFTKGYSMELNAFYLSPFLEGIYHTKARSYVNLAFKKTMLSDKLSVSLAFNDIFFGQVRRTMIQYQNLNGTGVQTFDTRRINVSINYNFGKLKVEQRQAKDIDPPSKSGK